MIEKLSAAALRFWSVAQKLQGIPHRRKGNFRWMEPESRAKCRGFWRPLTLV